MSWTIGIDDLEALAIGAAILGTGGGGDPHIGRVMAEAAMRENGPVTVYDVDELDDDMWVIPIAGMGAPTVLFEKVPRGTEPVAAFSRLEGHLGAVGALPCPIEAGGINSLVPLQVAAALKRPMVDADGMGRAFPELYMQTLPENSSMPPWSFASRLLLSSIDSRPSRINRPSLRALLIVPRTIAFLASWVVIGYSAIMAAPPTATVAVRASRSVHALSIASMVR